MAASGLSPASSPRLPSPPPIAEDQIGPTSPGLSSFEDHSKTTGSSNIDTGAARRIRPGTKAEDIAEGPPLVELQEVRSQSEGRAVSRLISEQIDSAFQLTEHLKSLYSSYTHPSNSNHTIPINADLARQLAQPPPNTSKEIWLYELGRFLIQKTNTIIVGLFADSPPCSQLTCPEMRASEWQYLCAVHDPPKSCAAIDYCCHTLDWAATALTNSKMFPSRLGLGSGNMGAGNDKVLQQQMKEITNIFRRVYRIFAHAWFQHREMFWRVEGKTGLYVFFKTVCDVYGMIQPENYTIPTEAEGQEPELTTLDQVTQSIPTILKRQPGMMHGSEGDDLTLPEPAGTNVTVLGDTTKRHRHTRSDLGSPLATVIQEEVEEDDSEPTKPAFGRQTTALRNMDDESGGAPEAGNDNNPTLGIERADTLKPPSQVEEPETKDLTLLGPGTKTANLEDKDIMDPDNSPAGEGNEAEKSVAD